MKQKIRFLIEALLIVAAVVAMCCNFAAEREIAYAASIVAVCGTSAILARDVYKAAAPRRTDDTGKEEKRP